MMDAASEPRKQTVPRFYSSYSIHFVHLPTLISTHAARAWCVLYGKLLYLPENLARVALPPPPKTSIPWCLNQLATDAPFPLCGAIDKDG